VYRKILLINPFGIGDVLFTTPVIKAIKNNYPDSIIGYWCNERVKDVLRNNPNLDKIFALSRGDLKKIFEKSKWLGIRRFLNLIYKIQKERFDICFDFSLDHRYSIIAKISGIKKRIGFNYKNRGRFLTDKSNIDGYHDKHVIEYYLDLLKFINIVPKNKNLELFVSKEAKLKCKEILATYGIGDNDFLIGIAPGGGMSWGRDAVFKHWPYKNFAQLADRIIDNYGAKILVLGDESERFIARAIVSAMKNKVIDLIGKTDLEELIAMVTSSKILIANDGGPLHIAKALNIKTVSIFGPVDENVYGPYPTSENDVVIKKDISCRPCYKYFRFNGCFNKRRCVEDISVAEVYSAVGRLI